MGASPIGLTAGRRAKHGQDVEVMGLGLGIAVSSHISVARWKGVRGHYRQGPLELLKGQWRLMPNGANFRRRLPPGAYPRQWLASL